MQVIFFNVLILNHFSFINSTVTEKDLEKCVSISLYN